MPATTTLKSIPCPTPEAATASLQGSILEFGRGGHEVNVRGVDIQEMEDGTFIALAILEIEEIEEEEELDEAEKSSTREAEELIEKENELFWMTHGSRDSEAKRAIPEVDDTVDANEQAQAMPVGYMEDRDTPEESVAEDDRIGLNQSAEELADTFENDFTEAMSPEPVPEGTIPDSALGNPMPAFTAEELREIRERREREDEVLAAMAMQERKKGDDALRPTPEE